MTSSSGRFRSWATVHPNEFFLAAKDVQGGRFVLVDLPEAEGAWPGWQPGAQRGLINGDLIPLLRELDLPGRPLRLLASF